MTLRDDQLEETEEDSEVGYRRPPKATRFTKGQSGNPAGRPRGRHRESPYEAVLGQMVTIREGGAGAPRHSGRGLSAATHKIRPRGRQRSSPRTAGYDPASQGTAGRRPSSCGDYHRDSCGPWKRHIRAPSAANGQENRPLPGDCANGPRTVDCGGRVGPSRSDTQSRRTADHCESHSDPPQGRMARLVDGTSMTQSATPSAVSTTKSISSSSTCATVNVPARYLLPAIPNGGPISCSPCRPGQAAARACNWER